MDLGIGGRVALVTGGSRGLGRQAALSLAQEGASVAICARTQETLDAVVPELLEAGAPAASGIAADVTDPASLQALHEAVSRQLGNVDILVNNAGASRRGDVLAIGEDDWADLWALNVMAPATFEPSRIARHAGEAVGAHRQRVLHLGTRARRRRRLYDDKGGADRPDKEHRLVLRKGWDSGQFRRPGLRRLSNGKLGPIPNAERAGGSPGFY